MRTQAVNKLLQNLSPPQSVEEDVETVCFDSLLILSLPISLSNNHMFGPLSLEQCRLFLLPHNIQQRYSQSLAVFVEHSAQSRCCSRMDDALPNWRLVVDDRHADDS